MRSEGGEGPEVYRSGGLLSGIVGLVGSIFLLVYGLVAKNDGFAAWAYPLILLVAVLSWAILIRPAVLLHDDEIELRNVLHSRWVPFGRVELFEVKQFTAVHVAGQRYVGSGFGRSRMAIRRDARAGGSATERHSLGWFVEEKVRRRIDAEKAADPRAVRRTWAWPELAAVAVLAVATVVTFLVA